MKTEVPEELLPEADEHQPTEDEIAALDKLFEGLYEKIKRLASRIRWSGTNPTLNPTALAHEAYLKLRNNPPEFSTRSYDEVIAIFAHAMHQILIDAGRRKASQKRAPVDLPVGTELPIEDAIAVGAALEKLSRENIRQAQIVRSRFLLGMTTDETAAALRLGRRTVEREWQNAQARLYREIKPLLTQP